MGRSLLIFLFVHAALYVPAQYKVRFIVKDLSETKRDSIFIAGSFNNWNPAPDKRYKLEPYNSSEKSILLNLPAGHYEYKYHGGGWLKVEKQWNSAELDNRSINVTGDTIIHDEVEEWRDVVFKNKRLALVKAKNDTTRIWILIAMAQAFGFNADRINTDSALYYINQAMHVLEDMQSQNRSGQWPGYRRSLMDVSRVRSALLYTLGDYPKSLELHFQLLQMVRENKDSFSIVNTLLDIAHDYSAIKDFSSSFDYCRKASIIYSATQKPVSDPRFAEFERWVLSYFADIYNEMNIPDSTLNYARRLWQVGTGIEGDVASASFLLGDNCAARGLYDSAFYYYRLCIPHASNTNMVNLLALSQRGLAKLYKERGQIDSALYYAQAAMSTTQNNRTSLRAWWENPDSYLSEISPLLADIYKLKQQPDSAYKYLQFSVKLKDSLFNADKLKQLQTLTFSESMKRQQEEQKEREAKQKYETRLKMYGLIGGILALLLIAAILYRNNKQKQKSNLILQNQKKDIENALSELRATQKQLIQSEKMASLGELTAGIAHEIQNPLNFVNNFSEVNKELLAEMNEEIAKGNLNEVKAIANDVIENESKINHHGKRADAIVKGMLQHSRTSTGQKELTDINALADEYLRLSYHGLRAKDKNFNAKFVTDFDNSIGKINIVPQDLGRVLLNLFNNAFYAAQAPLPSDTSGFTGVDPTHVPTVWVSTKKDVGRVLISVNDNGPGIPAKILDKIFQPFFTTKPTGEGTGLGLSLSYDIVTKGHSGELKVVTTEGEGTEFIIVLPVMFDK